MRARPSTRLANSEGVLRTVTSEGWMLSSSIIEEILWMLSIIMVRVLEAVCFWGVIFLPLICAILCDDSGLTASIRSP